MKIRRKIEISVISDVHLGTHNCNAKLLLTYLNSIEPKKLILNGDIIDGWQTNERYFPKSHLKVIKKIMDMSAEGVDIYYITGNHDETLRKFSGTTIGNISIVDKLVLNLYGETAWFFHGDVFDSSTQTAKWLAKLGDYGYYFLNTLNKLNNWYRVRCGKKRYSLSNNLKKGVKSSIKHVSKYEKTISDLAIEYGYDYVICGHIHQPKKEYIENKYGKIMYLNSGDWVENYTALEYQFKRWKINYFKKDKLAPFYVDEDFEEMEMKDLIAAITIVEQRKKKSK